MTVSEEIASTFVEAEADQNVPDTLTLEEDSVERLHRDIDGKPVGNVHHCPTYDCLAYYSLRDEQRHFYYKGKAYPLDDSILTKLEELGVEKIFVGLKHRRAVLEFDLEQYLEYEDGEKINHGNWGPQRYTPEANTLRVWPNAVGTLFDE